MIVKNEEDFIERCLNSVQHLVNEIIIVDTGSDDQTNQICSKFNASIYSFKWNNHFGEARNFGLSKATGDWILWLDADEELAPDDHQIILNTIEKTKASILLFPVINFYGDTFPVQQDQAFLHYQPRLFRNHLGIQFINRIHETPELPNSLNSKQQIEAIQNGIYHYGYIKDVIEKKEKAKRNLQILLAEYQKKEHSPWIEYHLASEFYRNKDFTTAFHYLNESILGFLLLGLKPPSILYRLKYDILLITNHLDEALLGIDKALLLYPDYVDLHFIKGVILLNKEQYSDAVISFDKCIELGENHTDYLILKGSSSFRALHFKQLCLDKLNAKSYES